MFDIADMAACDVMEDERNERGGDNSDRDVYAEYEFLEELGKGSYGVVSRVRRRYGGDIMAVKHIDKRAAGAKGLREVFSEVEILSLLRHPSIVRLEEIFEDKDNLWLVMDLVEGGELENELKKQGRFREDVTRRITRHILLALEYIHEKGIVHRDLKLANMLMSGRFEEGGNCEVKLADFGFSCVVSNESTLTSFCGTTVFMAPEILQDRPYGKPVDMWAVGVITYLLMYGVLPFSSNSEPELLRQICEADFEFHDADITPAPSKECKNFIARLLVLDPLQRVTATEALHLPWVKGSDRHSTGYSDDEEEGVDAVGASCSPLRYRKTPLQRMRKVFLVIRAGHRLVYKRRLRRMEEEAPDVPSLREFSYLVCGRYEKHSALSIADTSLSNRMVQRVCDIVESSRRLESLTLSNVGLNYDALQMVVKSAASAHRLTLLDLSGNAISSAGARAILRLARASRLKTITLRGTGVAGDIIGQIDSALKEVKGGRKAPGASTGPGSSRTGAAVVGGGGHRTSTGSLSKAPKSSSLPSINPAVKLSPGGASRRREPTPGTGARGGAHHSTPRSKHSLDTLK